VVYSGPRTGVVPFFESMGFRCPERKAIPDFLQEVNSVKDQAARTLTLSAPRPPARACGGRPGHKHLLGSKSTELLLGAWPDVCMSSGRWAVSRVHTFCLQACRRVDGLSSGNAGPFARHCAFLGAVGAARSNTGRETSPMRTCLCPRLWSAFSTRRPARRALREPCSLGLSMHPGCQRPSFDMDLLWEPRLSVQGQ